MNESAEPKKQRRSILEAWKAAYRMLDKSQRGKIHRWLMISLTGRSIQAFGVISVMPFVALISAPDLMYTHPTLSQMFYYSGTEDYQGFLTLVGACTIAFYLMTAGFTCFEVWYGARLSNDLGHSFSTRLFGIYMRQDYALHLKRNRATALDLITDEAESTMVGVLITGIEILSNIFMAFLITAMVMFVSVKAAITAAVVLGIAYTIIHFSFAEKVEKHGEEVYDFGIVLMNIVQEALAGIREIKTHHAEDNFRRQHSEISREIADHTTNHALLEFAPRQLLEATAFSGIVVFALVSMSLYPNPGEVMPMIALYGLAAYRLIPTLREVYSDMETINYAKFMVSRLEEEFAQDPPPPSEKALTLDLSQDPLVEFRGIGFTYPGESEAVLEDFNWQLNAHRRTALIGPSGAGKSTIIDLLTGLLRPSAGEIRIAGTVLDVDSMSSWQRHISYISQSIYLFDGTLAQNISMQDRPENIDLDRVVAAAAQAELASFIDTLEDGYDTVVGIGQKLLSGGQLRRLGIARALYRQPELLILDESLNELDSETQASILKTISALEDITVLVVSHDPRVLAYCDLKHEIAPLARLQDSRATNDDIEEPPAAAL